jgi:hypothetical protein
MLDLWWWHVEQFPGDWCNDRRHWLHELPKDADLLVSRLMRREVLSRYLKTTPDKLTFQVDAQGKPHLVGSGLHFNVTHGFGWHSLLVGDQPCGVDVEPWDRPLERVRRPAVIKRFAEAETLADGTDADFLRCWTMKEALAKCRGVSVWQVLSEPLRSVADGWRAPSGFTSGHRDTGACVSWVTTADEQPSVVNFANELGAH